MKSDLHKHIANQQTLAMRLNFVLEALERLNSESVAEEAQSTLIAIAAEMAAELNNNLDNTRLPETEEAA